MSLFRYVEHQVKIAATAEIVNGTLYIDFSAKETVLAHYLRLEVLSRNVAMSRRYACKTPQAIWRSSRIVPPRCGGDDVWSCVTLRKPSEKRS